MPVQNLQWKNFDSSISEAFKNMRSQSDLFDVTLGCPGSRSRTLQAHQVILSASSTFFQDILCQQIKQSSSLQPFIYLQGVKFPNLSWILDFIYNQEVSIPKEKLDSFLHDAQVLGISGIPSNNVKTIPEKKKELKRRIEELKIKKLKELNVKKTIKRGKRKKPGRKSKIESPVSDASRNDDEAKPNIYKSISQSINDEITKKAVVKLEPWFESRLDLCGGPCDGVKGNVRQARKKISYSEANATDNKKGVTNKRIKTDKDDSSEQSLSVRRERPTRNGKRTKNNEIVCITADDVEVSLSDDKDAESSELTELDVNNYYDNAPSSSEDSTENDQTISQSDEITNSPNIVQEEVDEEVEWPPAKGKFIATMFEDNFYIGKVCSSPTKDKNVKVNFMERYSGHNDDLPSDEDMFWTWPKQEDISYATYDEALGTYPAIELKDKQGQGKKIYVLKNYTFMSALASNSKMIISHSM